jgi:hypothetical protein
MNSIDSEELQRLGTKVSVLLSLVINLEKKVCQHTADLNVIIDTVITLASDVSELKRTNR